MRDIYNEILKYISEDIRDILKKVNPGIWEKAEEIRIFSERHIIIYTSNLCKYVEKNGTLNDEYNNVFIPSYKSVEKTVSLMCNNSIYSELDNIKNGFITLPYGHRVGIVGNAVLNENKINYIKNVSCINIRIMREVKGFSEKIIPYILSNNKINNTLIISPPQCGKTTLIRDIARVLGGTNKCVKVGIVDERNEIASTIDGKVYNNIGEHTFVISNCPKNEGMNILIRAMSPQVIITDEIGNVDDANAIKKALCSGVNIITTIHANNETEFLKNEFSKSVKDLFDVYVVLSRTNGPGTLEKVIKRGDLLGY